MSTSNKRIDFNFNMTAHPLTKDLAVVRNSAARKQALRNIVLTNFGERGFEPDYVSGINDMLFDVASPSTITLIKNHIKTAIENYESEVELISVDVEWDENAGAVTAWIKYTELNDPDPVTVDVDLTKLIR